MSWLNDVRPVIVISCFVFPQEQRQATRENVERKQARTSDELEEEEEHEEGHESDSDDEETVLYNPKNLPLGWDGKVMPFALLLYEFFFLRLIKGIYG